MLINLFISFFKFSEHFIRGNLGSPKLYPSKFKASLTGIGFVSLKRVSIKARDCNWYVQAFFKSPSKNEFTISKTRFGLILDNTEITPWPPIDKIGTIPVSESVLAEVVKKSVAEIKSELVVLELQGLIRKQDGGYVRL